MKVPRQLRHILIGKTFAWVFYEACQGKDSGYSASGVCHLNEGHFFKFKSYLELGENNMNELMAPKTLMQLVV